MIFKAEELTNMHQIAEADGFLWNVSEILSETEKTITVRLNSDFSSYKRHHSGSKGIVKVFHKSTNLHGIKPNVDEIYNSLALELLA